MTEPSQTSFFDRLHSVEREQGMIQLRTLLARHQQNLAKLPRLAAELQAILATTEAVDYAALATQMQSALTQAADLLLAVDLAPIDHPKQPDLITLGQSLCPLVNSGNIVALSVKFRQARDSAAKVVKAAQDEQVRAVKAAHAEQAKADAERAKEALVQQAVIDRREAATAFGFVDNGNGTVTDTQTGLMWKQCAEGQNGADCQGCGGEFNWDVAMQIPKTLNLRGGFAGYRDWRLPTKDELTSLVMHGRTSPAICTEAFPNAPSHWFWSSSPSVVNLTWYVHFGDGEVNSYYRYFAGAVRLVRSSQ